MAEIRKITPLPVTPPPKYTLELSEDEFHALLAVFGRIGGSPDYSARGHIDSIHKAIKRDLHLDYGDSKYYRTMRDQQGIFFEEYGT